MKNAMIFSFVLCMLAGCYPASNPTIKRVQKNDRSELKLASNEVNSLNPLESYLLRTPGVQLVGEGGGVKAKVRGASSFFGETEPLFVVNGTDIGNSYSKASNLVAGMEILSVKVLKGPDASLYGVRGGNGVVVIRAK